VTSHQPAVSRRAFTLIELLVVLAIIAVLVGILFSVISLCKEPARKARCISNLRQLYQALEMYRADFGDYLYNWRKLYPNYVTDFRLFQCESDWDALEYGWLGLPPVENPWDFRVSYLNVYNPTGMPEEDIPPWRDIYALRGEETPLIVDKYHTPKSVYYSGNGNKTYLVCRVGGQVDIVRTLYTGVSWRL